MQTEMAALQGWYPALMYEAALEPVMSAVAHRTGCHKMRFAIIFIVEKHMYTQFIVLGVF